ncbi:MAG TPA: hypothetical protein VN515_02120 [Terriglobales bacterium]|nr:hypothetical protein [Terriglobales bacterium]
MSATLGLKQKARQRWAPAGSNLVLVGRLLRLEVEDAADRRHVDHVVMVLMAMLATALHERNPAYP